MTNKRKSTTFNNFNTTTNNNNNNNDSNDKARNKKQETSVTTGEGEEDYLEREFANKQFTLFEQNYFKCPICKDFLRKPMCLEICQHVFCLQCLQNHMRTFDDDRKRCLPQCNAKVTRDSEFDGTGKVLMRCDLGREKMIKDWVAENGLRRLILNHHHHHQDTDNSNGKEEEEEEKEKKQNEEEEPLKLIAPPPMLTSTKANNKERAAKLDQLRKTLVETYNFNKQKVYSQSFEDLRVKYNKMRSTHNDEVEFYKRKPDIEQIVRTIEEEEDAKIDEEKKTALMVKQSLFIGGNSFMNNKKKQESEIFNKLFQRPELKEHLEKAEAMQQKQQHLKDLKAAQEKTMKPPAQTIEMIEILASDDDDGDENKIGYEPLPMSQHQKPVEEEEEEDNEEEIVNTQEIYT